MVHDFTPPLPTLWNIKWKLFNNPIKPWKGTYTVKLTSAGTSYWFYGILFSYLIFKWAFPNFIFFIFDSSTLLKVEKCLTGVNPGSFVVQREIEGEREREREFPTKCTTTTAHRSQVSFDLGIPVPFCSYSQFNVLVHKNNEIRFKCSICRPLGFRVRNVLLTVPLLTFQHLMAGLV